jgi:hypothetical protein
MKVLTDGTPGGTHVILPDGTELTNVQWVQIFVSEDEELSEITICLKAKAEILDTTIYKVQNGR